ncbi:hypothetical protein OROHE_004940 [Orobanche hederae]
MLFYKSALFLCGCLSVVVERNANSRTAIINRPSSLNALNIPMIDRLQKLYRSWEDNRDIGFVVLKGRGPGFCAGGDVISIYNLLKEGNVAILHGTTMGGGAGISVTGMFRVATDKTIFATPETLIGFHPDGGASFYLSRLPGYLGEYLALTGDKLNGAEMRSCGLATHYLLNTKLSSAEKKLVNLVTGDPSSIENCLAMFEDSVRPGPDSVVHRIETIDQSFSNDTVEEIIDSLIREGRFQSLEQCLIREYRMTVQAISMQITRDFYEGVRAKLVDKDFAPKVNKSEVFHLWDPPSLEHVSQDMVDRYFSPITQFEPDLELPTKKPELLTKVPIVVP